MNISSIARVAPSRNKGPLFTRILSAIFSADAHYRDRLHIARLSDAELKDIGMTPAERDGLVGRHHWDAPRQMTHEASLR